MSYNPRLQPNQIQYFNQAGNLMSLQYGFVDASSHNNGNVMGITNLVDATRSQQFIYDQLNRLLTHLFAGCDSVDHNRRGRSLPIQ